MAKRMQAKGVAAPHDDLCTTEHARPASMVEPVLAVVPAPEFLDRHVAILGYPVNQRLGRPEGLSELLPQ
jgi:hypothetical protein